MLAFLYIIYIKRNFSFFLGDWDSSFRAVPFLFPLVASDCSEKWGHHCSNNCTFLYYHKQRYDKTFAPSRGAELLNACSLSVLSVPSVGLSYCHWHALSVGYTFVQRVYLCTFNSSLTIPHASPLKLPKSTIADNERFSKMSPWYLSWSSLL